MNLSAILIVLFAASASVNANILDDVFGDVIQKEVALFQEIVAQIKSGAAPLDIIKNAVSKFPKAFENFDLIKRVCTNPVVTKFDFAVTACKFIQEQQQKIEDFLQGHKPVQKDDRIFLEFGALAAAVQAAIPTFTTIASGIAGGQSAATIVTSVVTGFPVFVQSFKTILSICENPSATKFDIVVKACNFIKEQKEHFINAINKLTGKVTGRGIVQDVFGDVIQKQLALIKELEEQIAKGGNPIDIIKNAFTKFPQTFQNFDLIDKACGSPVVQSIGFAKSACEFIQKYHDQIHQIIGKTSITQERGIFSEVFDNFLQNQIAFLKQIADQLKNAGGPAGIVKEIVARFPDTLKNFELIKSICSNPALQKIDYANQACKFLVAQEAAIKQAISQLIGQRGLFNDIFDNLIQQNLALFKEVEAQIKSGVDPATIIKNAITKFPEPFKKFDLIVAVCSNPTVQSIGLAKLACQFVQQNKDQIKQVVDQLIAPGKEQLQEALEEFQGEFKPQLAILKEIYDKIMAGKNTPEIIQPIISKYAKEIPALKAACNFPLAQKIEFVAKACEFLGVNGQKVNKLIEIQCAEQNATDRFFNPISYFAQFKDEVEVIKEITAMVKNGTNPVKIISYLVMNHIKFIPQIKAICDNFIVKNIDFLNDGCVFINVNKPSLNRAFFEEEAQRGLLGDILGNVFDKYKDQIELVQFMASEFQAGKSLQDVIISSLKKYPQNLKNFTAITAACNLPAIKNVVPFCKVVNENADKIIEIATGILAKL